MISTVIFDIGSVLVYSRFREFFDETTSQKIIDVTLKSDIWKKMDLGEATFDDVKAKNLEGNPDLAKDIQLFFDVYQSTYTVNEPVLEFFKNQKKQGRRAMLLSNFGRELFEESITPLEFYELADGMVISYREHCAKPGPEIYHLLLDRYELTPSECVFIDDQLKNVEAARECGIKAIQFKNAEQLESEFAGLVQ